MSETMTIAVYELDFLTDKPSMTVRADSATFDHANDKLYFFLRGEKIESLKPSEISGWYIRMTQDRLTTP